MRSKEVVVGNPKSKSVLKPSMLSNLSIRMFVFSDSIIPFFGGSLGNIEKYKENKGCHLTLPNKVGE